MLIIWFHCHRDEYLINEDAILPLTDQFHFISFQTDTTETNIKFEFRKVRGVKHIGGANNFTLKLSESMINEQGTRNTTPFIHLSPFIQPSHFTS